MIRQFRALILGAPGSGKGTISSRIVRKFDLKHIASGDILRNNIINNTAVGQEVKALVDKGKLVPDEVMVKLILDEIKKCDGNWLLDGFPRTKQQAEILYEKAPVDAAINLIVPFDVIIDRIQGRWIHPTSGRVYNTGFNPPKVSGQDDVTGEPLIQRNDDKPESVKKRLEIYCTTIGPVLDFYRDKGVLEDFTGKTSDEIWPMVYKYLSLRVTPIGQDERTS